MALARRLFLRTPMALVACAAAACSASASKGNSAFDEQDAGTSGSSRDGGDYGGGISGGLDASIEGGLGRPMAVGCTADLQAVVDDKGAVVRKCPPDQGCAKGECVPACEAAAASHGTIGCDFVVATPSFYSRGITPPCFAVFVANAWSKSVKVAVTRGGATLDATKFVRIPNGGVETSWPTMGADGVPKDQVAVMFLSSDPNSRNGSYPLKCPVAPGINAGTAVLGSGKGQAFHIKTDVPVSAYDIIPYGGARSFLPSAQLLLPTSAWGKNYIAVVPPPQTGPQWGQVVAASNDTTIRIVPTVSLSGGGGVAPAAARAVNTYKLNAGEYIQWEPSNEMSGSVLSSDKPIAFNGGTGYLCLRSATSTGGGCDCGHQGIPPISALGSEYVAAPYATRRADLQEESIQYRIVGTVDGTTLTYDPPGTPGPANLRLGQVVDFEAIGPFRIKSQDKDHPFYVAQLMSGTFVTSGSRPGAGGGFLGGGNLGDEEFVNLLPPAQFLSRYIFFTDPSYPTTNLVLTRTKKDGVFKDVSVECIGTVTGWKPVGTSGQYEVANVDLVRSGKGIGKCKNGQQSAKSDGQFGVVVWGEDTFSSYAYPAGGNVGAINTVVVPALPK